MRRDAKLRTFELRGATGRNRIKSLKNSIDLLSYNISFRIRSLRVLLPLSVFLCIHTTPSLGMNSLAQAGFDALVALTSTRQVNSSWNDIRIKNVECAVHFFQKFRAAAADGASAITFFHSNYSKF